MDLLSYFIWYGNGVVNVNLYIAIITKVYCAVISITYAVFWHTVFLRGVVMCHSCAYNG